MRPRLVFAAFLLSSFSAAAAAAKPETPGFGPAFADAAGTVPIHVVVLQPRIRPRLLIGDVSTPFVNTGAQPGWSFGQGLGVSLAANLLMYAAMSSDAKARAVAFAQPPFATIRAQGCDLPTLHASQPDASQPAIVEAVVDAIRTRWPDARIQVAVLEKGQDIDDVTPKRTAPHVRLQVSSTLAADFTALIAHIEAEGYPGAGRKPAWRDTLIAVSDTLALPAKTDDETARFIAAENVRYEALNLGPTIARINARGGTGRPHERAERKRVARMIEDHKTILAEAQRPSWTPLTGTQRLATLWSEDGCGHMRTALSANARDAGVLVAALFGQTLPPRMPMDSARHPREIPGERAILSFAGGVFVLRRGGDRVEMGHHEALLED